MSTLRWRSVGGSLERLMTDIDADEWFTIEYKRDRWELRIHERNIVDRGVLVDCFATRREAEEAAARLVGDDDEEE